MSLLSHKFGSALIASGLLLAAAPVGAAKYFADLFVNQEVFYDGNIVLGPVIKEEVEAYGLAPKVKLAGQGANWQANLDVELLFTRFSNQLYNSDDQIAGLSLRRFSERQSWQLDGAIARESTRTAVDVLDDVVAASRTVSRSLRPTWTRVLNEKNSLSFGGSWLEMEYREPRFSDYEQYSFDANWIRQLDQRQTLQVSLYNSRFQSGIAPFVYNDPGLPALESDTLGLSAGLTRQFNEDLTGSITLGTRRVDTTARLVGIFIIFPFADTRKSESSGFTAAADIQYAGETWSGSARLSRSLNPNGLIGDLLETDEVVLNYSRQLRESLFFDLKLSFTSENTIDTDVFQRDRWTATPALRWRFTERWTLITSLRHRSRETVRNLTPIDADGTSINFKVRYAHPRAIWSR